MVAPNNPSTPTRASHSTKGSLIAQGLRKTYGKRTVVQDVSLTVESGEVVGLLGPNGAGKTTSFYMIVGIVAADAGAMQGRLSTTCRARPAVVHSRSPSAA